MSWKPPSIPPRRPGWERGFVSVMEKQMALPFGWTPEAHCLGAPALLCEAMTGVDPMRGIRPYASEATAWRRLAKLGFRSVEEALEAVFPEIDILRARRGDCGVLEQVVNGKPWIATFVVLGDRSLGRSPDGPVFVPTAALKRAFAIGAP
jgi:hypothetical protein